MRSIKCRVELSLLRLVWSFDSFRSRYTCLRFIRDTVIMAYKAGYQSVLFYLPANMAQDPHKVSLRSRLVAKRQAGMSVAAIAEDEGVSQTTVKKWWTRWQAEGDVCDHPRSGRPRKTTLEEDQRISEQARQTPITNAVQIREQIQLQVSRKTVCNRLHEAGVHHRIPAEKENLTERHRNRRLVFAQQYVNMDLDYWGRVIFSDEKSFSSTTHGRPHCWRRNGTRYNRENIYEVARSGHVTCSVWGWVHLYGVGELTAIDGRLTAEKYIEILEEVMVPTVRAMAIPYPERIIFMQVRISLTVYSISIFMSYIHLYETSAYSTGLNLIN